VNQIGDGFKTAKTKASFIEPMLLLRSETPPEGSEWMYELKLDGYRALAIKTGQRVQLARAITMISPASTRPSLRRLSACQVLQSVTVTRKKVAGMEVASLRGLLF